jgi:hypothetical protein
MQPTEPTSARAAPATRHFWDTKGCDITAHYGKSEILAGAPGHHPGAGFLTRDYSAGLARAGMNG